VGLVLASDPVVIDAALKIGAGGQQSRYAAFGFTSVPADGLIFSVIAFK